MLKNHLKDQIILKLTFPPTENQLFMIDALADIVVSTDEAVLLVNGYAGTGKTSVIAAFVKLLNELHIQCVLLAPTGRGAKVLSNYAALPAYTIHRKIYRQVSSGHFEMDRNLAVDTFFIIDEASLIAAQNNGSIFGTGDLLDDIMTYVFSGIRCKLILLGDSAQLSPIGEEISRALVPDYFRIYPVDVKSIYMHQVVRQSNTSGIIANATSIRLQMSAPLLPLLQTYPDVIQISGAELIDTLSDAYSQYGEDQVVVITSSNKRAMQYSLGIRNQILYKESELESGDRLMIVKNNYFWTKEFQDLPFLANGETAEVVRVRKFHEIYGFRFADVCLRIEALDHREIEVRVLLDSLLSDTAMLSNTQMNELSLAIAADYEGLTNTIIKKKLRENPYLNALQIKFAYSITCHKAQGGQWDTVFIDYTLYNQDPLHEDYLKWLYTAITRSVSRVYLINFPNEFFANNLR